jgi:lipopolysaccharide export system protein LptA
MLVAMLCCTSAVFARTSDRNQPMDAESNQNSCILSDSGQCVMTGNVHITQGSLDITAAKAVIYRAGGEISRAVLTGSPAVLKQQMDDGTPMTAHAGNVDYNLQNEVVVFTGDVELQQPRGTMAGQRVVYNLKTGAIDSGGAGNGRVKMRILPKNPAPAATPAPTAETAPPKTTP